MSRRDRKQNIMVKDMGDKEMCNGNTPGGSRPRLISECSSEGWENLTPLDLDDLTCYENKDKR